MCTCFSNRVNALKVVRVDFQNVVPNFCAGKPVETAELTVPTPTEAVRETGPASQTILSPPPEVETLPTSPAIVTPPPRVPVVPLVSPAPVAWAPVS